jgi:hypothetical protein
MLASSIDSDVLVIAPAAKSMPTTMNVSGGTFYLDHSVFRRHIGLRFLKI